MSLHHTSVKGACESIQPKSGADMNVAQANSTQTLRPTHNETAMRKMFTRITLRVGSANVDEAPPW